MGVFLNRGNEEFKSAVNSQIYVDKTDMISFLNGVINTEQRYICVSRPRRFGKTMTANMIAAYFEKDCDSRELFECREIGKFINWDRNLNKYDVIRIDMADVRTNVLSADEALDYIQRKLKEDLLRTYIIENVKEQETVTDILDLINSKYGVSFVIIIDEWDALFRDDRADENVQHHYINFMRSLFKGNRSKKFTALAYITGILPIKKYNSESALNNFREYTMLNPYQLAKYIGFTSNEVENLCKQYRMDYQEAMEWYDGYSFNREKHICGPNSVICAMTNGEYDNYWSQTVAYNSLTNYITMNYDGLKDAIKLLLGGQHVHVDTFSYANDLVSFHDRDSVLTALIHLGYLAYNQELEEVYIPNKEVRQIFERAVKESGWNELIHTLNASSLLLDATLEGDEEAVARAIDCCHMENTSILNYNNENALACVLTLAYYTAKKEYVILRELPTGRGFADLVFIPKVNVDKPAMIMELKWKKEAQTAINQIYDRKYPASLERYYGKILLVGISYDAETKKHSCRIEKQEIRKDIK